MDGSVEEEEEEEEKGGGDDDDSFNVEFLEGTKVLGWKAIVMLFK